MAGFLLARNLKQGGTAVIDRPCKFRLNRDLHGRFFVIARKEVKIYMTTKVELMGTGVSRLLARRGISNESVVQEGKSQRFLLGEFADTADKYDTAVGKVGVDFDHDVYFGIEVSRKVVFDCSDAKLLQGMRHRLAREVEITRDGTGKQNLTSGIDIVVSTDAFGRKR